MTAITILINLHRIVSLQDDNLSNNRAFPLSHKLTPHSLDRIHLTVQNTVYSMSELPLPLDFPPPQSLLPSSLPLSLSCFMVPCVPDYLTGAFIPLYSLSNYPYTPPQKKELPHSLSAAPFNRGGIKNKNWTEQEDLKLLDLVQELGTKQWMQIARMLNREFYGEETVRKGKHCRERWHNHVDPDLNSETYIEGEWSYSEDILLLKEQRAIGNKWSSIARLLSGRTENGVKNRYNSLIKKAKAAYSLESYPDESVSYILIQQFEEMLIE